MMTVHSGGIGMADVEIFTPFGVLAGTTARAPLSNDGPDLSSPLVVDEGRWYPIDGGSPAHRDADLIVPDDILLIATPEPELFVHLAWFPIRLEIGPYRVSGLLGTHPGFDPARALARPGSTFIALREATIQLLARREAAPAVRASIHVNRYAVEAVTSTLMLGFHFPGARHISGEPGALDTDVVEPGTRGTRDAIPAA